MATNSDKKLTTHTSAVTVVTAEVMNALYGGEYAHNLALYAEDPYHPLVSGHVHDGEHADGHASKVNLTGGAHVRGTLSHANLGGTGGTDPAVQKDNIVCYPENQYGPNGGGNAIPVYEVIDGHKCYYLDLSMIEFPAGDDTHVQYNKDGDFGGDAGFVYDYDTGRVGIGTDTPPYKLSIDSENNTASISITEKKDSHVGPDLYFRKARLLNASQDQDYLANIVVSSWDGDSFSSAGGIQFRADGNHANNDVPAEIRFVTREAGQNINWTSGTRLIIKNDGDVGIGTDTPSVKLDVIGDGIFTGDLTVGGKLTVDGLIDPTGLILTEENESGAPGVPTGPNKGAIFVSDGNGSNDVNNNPLEKNKLYYKDENDNITRLGGGGDPSPPDRAVQFNDSGIFAGDSSIIIDSDLNLGVGVDANAGEPIRRLHIRDDRDLPPVRINDLTYGNGENVVWNKDTGDLHHRPLREQEQSGNHYPHPRTWDTGDIVVEEIDVGRLVLVVGEWDGSSRVVIPRMPPYPETVPDHPIDPPDPAWRHGDVLHIKGLTTYVRDTSSRFGGASGTQTSYGGDPALTVSQMTELSNQIDTYYRQDYIPLQIIGDHPEDTIDGVPLMSGYTLPPKGAIKLCCIKEGSVNHWVITSHYVEHSVDQPPVARIMVLDDEGNVVSPGILYAEGHYTFNASRHSSDPDGDGITDYAWSIVDQYGTVVFSTTQADFSMSFSSFSEQSFTAYLQSTPAFFPFSVEYMNESPVAVVYTPSGSSGAAGVSVTVDGSNSYDPDGYTEDMTFSWSLVNQPAGSTVNLNSYQSDPYAEVINFIPDVPGAYEVSLVVNDGYTDDSASVTFTATTNLDPVLNIFGDNPLIIAQTPTVSYYGLAEDNLHGAPWNSSIGASAFDPEVGDISGSIQNSLYTASIDLSVPGSYDVTYSVTDNYGNQVSAVRQVYVIANAPPSIWLHPVDQNGNIAVELIVGGPAFTLTDDAAFDPNGNLGAWATDYEDTSMDWSDITVTGLPIYPTSVGPQAYTYTVTDSFGSTVSVDRLVNVVAPPNTAPVVTIVGDNPLELVVGTSYVDPGATATDAEDAYDPTVTASGTVDHNTLGTYTVTYTAMDSQGLAATATRTVNVVAPPNTDPTIGGISYIPSSPVANESVYLTASIYDPDSSDVLVYEWITLSSPSGASVQLSPTGPVTMSGQSGTAQATISSDKEGDHTFKLTVSDGTTTDVEYVTISINSQPVISLTGGSPYPIDYSDPNNWVEPGGSVFDAEDGAIVWSQVTIGGDSPDTSHSGEYGVTYSFTDSDGATAVENRTVQVRLEPTDSPALYATGMNIDIAWNALNEPQSGDPGYVGAPFIAYELYASDPNGATSLIATLPLTNYTLFATVPGTWTFWTVTRDLNGKYLESANSFAASIVADPSGGTSQVNMGTGTIIISGTVNT